MTWGGIKRDKIDAITSDLVRERNEWTCQRCNFICPDGPATGKSRRVENSHFIPRRHQATRYDPDNCDCLCKKCHQYFTEDNTGEYAAWKRSDLGDDRYDALIKRGQSICKRTKPEKEEMYQHLRAQMKYMLRRRRKEGETGWLEFVAWD